MFSARSQTFLTTFVGRFGDGRYEKAKHKMRCKKVDNVYLATIPGDSTKAGDRGSI